MRLEKIKNTIAAGSVLLGSCATAPPVTNTEKTHLNSKNDADSNHESAASDSQITVRIPKQTIDEETVALTDTSINNNFLYLPSNIIHNFRNNIKDIDIKHSLGNISENDAVQNAVVICEDTHDSIADAQTQVLTELCKENKIENPLCKDSAPLEMSECLDSEDILGCVKTKVGITSTKNQPNKAVVKFSQSLEGLANCAKSLQEKDTIYVKLGRLYKSIILENFKKTMNKTHKTIDDAIIRMQKNAERRKRMLDILSR